jgi:ppGpp synthetase/RelA/SpoT-type nucleotidyltranferase
VQARGVGNAAMIAALGGSPPGVMPAWSGQMMLAGQNLVGNQAVVATTGTSPTTRQAIPGQPPAQQQPVGRTEPGGKAEAGGKTEPAGKTEPGKKTAPGTTPAQPDTKGTGGRPDRGARKEGAGTAPSAVAGVAGPLADGGRAAGPQRLTLPSFARRFDVRATLPPVRANAGEQAALATAEQAFARLVARARRAHDVQLSLLQRAGRAALDRHDRLDSRTRSRVSAAEAELDDVRVQALAAVDSAYEQGTAGLEAAVKRGRRLVASASASALRRVRTNADTASAQITTIVNDLASSYTTILEQSAVAVTDAGKQAASAVQAYGANASTLFPGGETPLVEAENEARREAVPGLAAAAAKNLTDAAKGQAEGYRGQKQDVLDQFDASELATALRTRRDEINTKGRAAVTRATRTAYGALTEQAAAARAALRRMAADARQSIELRCKVAKAQLNTDADGLVHASRSQTGAELSGLTTAATTGLPAFDHMVTAVRDGLAPVAKNGVDSLRKAATEAAESTGPKVDQLGVEQQRMVTRADASTGAAVAEAERNAAQAAARARVLAARALRAAATAGARGMREFVGGHDASFAATARGVRQVADAWAMPLKQVFGEAVRKTKDAMTVPFNDTKRKTDEGRTKFIGDVFTPYLTPATPMAELVKPAADEVSARLDQREHDLVKAVGGWGTDEAGVSRALRGMTPAQGRALRWIFQRDLHSSIDATLTSELSGADLTSAQAYLRGDQVAGAAAELAASTHWYNDEEERIEEVMRNLKPEELARLKGSKDGAAALADVRDSLGGTDLRVFDALAAGNQDLADAFRMKDRIDDARRDGDLDAIHDTLVQYGKAPTERGRAKATADERRVAVQRELAGIVGEHDAASITPEQAAAAVEKYVLAPIDVVVAGPDGMSQVEKRDITGANRDLAVALVHGGEDTVAARAARLGVETQRPGGPNMLKLDAALVDPRLKPGAKVPEEEVKKARDERDRVFQKYAADYGGTGQAGTPAAAKTYLEGKLRTAYGDDKDAGDLAVRLAHEEYPTPKTAALAVQYASKGAGTDEELMFRFVERMDRDEIAAMRVEYKNLTGDALDDDLGTFGGEGMFTELSGDERLRMEVALLGVPRNDREAAEVAAFRIQQQRDETGGLGAWLAEDSLADRSLASAQSRLTASLGGATVRVDDKGNPVWTGSAGGPATERDTLFDEDGRYKGEDPREFASAVRVSKLAAEVYAAQIDTYASYLTTAVMVLGAIAAAVVTVATGGAASPLLLAAIAGLTGLTSMAVHSAVSGGRYGWEQAAVDLGMTAVQALTAGVGQHLSILARGGTQSLTAGMTTLRSAQGLGQTMGKLTGSTLGDLTAIGAATGAMGGFGGALLDENTWRKGLGHGFGELLTGTLTGALGGVVSTVTSHAVESLPVAKAAADGTRATLGDALSGSAAARAALRGTSSFLGGATGRGAELGVGAATGRFHGDAGDLLTEMGKAGLESAVQESAAGPVELRKRRPVHTGPAQDRLDQLRKEWPVLDRTLKRNPVARDSLLSHPESIDVLEASLRTVQDRLEAAGIADAVRRRKITPEVQEKVDAILRDLRAEHPNELLGNEEQLRIAEDIAAGTTKEGYRQLGFDLGKRKQRGYQRESVDRLRAEAPEAQAELNQIVTEIAGDLEGEASWRTEVKDRGRSLRKVREYVDDRADGDASMLVDVVGARIRFDSVDALYKALDVMKNDRRVNIVRIKDRVAKASPSGNRSVLMNVRLSNGHVGELKFSLKSFERASTAEHPLYEIRRDLESRASAKRRALTPVEALIKASTEAIARPMYGAAWQREMAGSRLAELLTGHPDVASIARRLVADSVDHPTNLAKALADPQTRDATIALLGELAEGRTLAGRTLEEYRAESEGRGPLFERVDPSVNKDAAGRDRKAVLVEQAKQLDPARDVGSTPTPEETALLADYAKRLHENVQPAVEAEVRAFVAQVAPGSTVSVRTKDAAGILDKIKRMTEGSESRPGRAGYRAGDVIDAVGARITTADMHDLARILEAAKRHFGTGADGRILEIDNMYAEPKSKNPAYRVIPLVVRVDVAGVPYTFELQLTTLRASIAADLEHNTLFKTYVELKATEEDRVRQMLAEAAALDQEETR